jgi:hypothetical protein
MKRVALIGLTLALSACETDATDPSKQPIVFTAQLTTGAEVPALPNPSEAGGSGTVTITMVLPRDASGNVTGDGKANFQFALTGFPPNTVIRLAHIHIGGAGVAGTIKVDTGLTVPTAITLADGSAVINATDRLVLQVDGQAILANPAGYYFNAHSNLNPQGVVRGQLVRQQ